MSDSLAIESLERQANITGLGLIAEAIVLDPADTSLLNADASLNQPALLDAVAVTLSADDPSFVNQ